MIEATAINEALSGSRRWACVKSDAVAFLDLLPDDSVDLLFTSPPYSPGDLVRRSRTGAEAMIQIVELGTKGCDKGNLYHSPSNQLRRALGKFETVYHGGVYGGTVQDAAGKCFDWWPTDEVLEGNFRRLRIVPAT